MTTSKTGELTKRQKAIYEDVQKLRASGLTLAEAVKKLGAGAETYHAAKHKIEGLAAAEGAETTKRKYEKKPKVIQIQAAPVFSTMTLIQVKGTPAELAEFARLSQ